MKKFVFVSVLIISLLVPAFSQSKAIKAISVLIIEMMNKRVAPRVKPVQDKWDWQPRSWAEESDTGDTIVVTEDIYIQNINTEITILNDPSRILKQVGQKIVIPQWSILTVAKYSNVPIYADAHTAGAGRQLLVTDTENPNHSALIVLPYSTFWDLKVKYLELLKEAENICDGISSGQKNRGKIHELLTKHKKH